MRVVSTGPGAQAGRNVDPNPLRLETPQFQSAPGRGRGGLLSRPVYLVYTFQSAPGALRPGGTCFVLVIERDAGGFNPPPALRPGGTGRRRNVGICAQGFNPPPRSGRENPHIVRPFRRLGSFNPPPAQAEEHVERYRGQSWNRGFNCPGRSGREELYAPFHGCSISSFQPPPGRSGREERMDRLGQRPRMVSIRPRCLCGPGVNSSPHVGF